MPPNAIELPLEKRSEKNSKDPTQNEYDSIVNGDVKVR